MKVLEQQILIELSENQATTGKGVFLPNWESQTYVYCDCSYHTPIEGQWALLAESSQRSAPMIVRPNKVLNVVPTSHPELLIVAANEDMKKNPITSIGF